MATSNFYTDQGYILQIVTNLWPIIYTDTW